MTARAKAFLAVAGVWCVLGVAANAQSLRAWWMLDETSGGTAADSSGNALNGTLTGSPAWEPGIVGNCLHLHGGDDAVNGPTTHAALNFANGTDITIAGWVKLDSLSSRTWLFEKGWKVDQGAMRSGYAVAILANGKVAGYFADETATFSMVSTATIGPGGWHHIAVVMVDSGAANCRTYIDAVSVGVTTTNNPSSLGSFSDKENQTLRLGRSGYYNEILVGCIDDVRLYAEALNASEIADLYSLAGEPPPTTTTEALTTTTTILTTTTTTLPHIHPADMDANWGVSISEITAYGAAWKTGTPWAKPPSQVPIEYVTDAGCIWKSGEAYYYDVARTPPLSWVAGTLPPGLTAGPLHVHPTNPRYFADRNGNVVYLTGSHNWNNFQDYYPASGSPYFFDYPAYLDMLIEWNHNFMRMWVFERVERAARYDPIPFASTGPGLTRDGLPKLDLTQFNQAYFDRLRERVMEARERGIYVSVMLFEGWSIYEHGGGNPWPLHPFNAANNINGINGDTNGNGEGEEVHTLGIPAITAIQEAYIRKVVDSINDLDNVLYEVTNETRIESKDWQYHIVNYVHQYEAGKPAQHPAGMSAFDSGRAGSMDALYASPSEWISPQGEAGTYDYDWDPPTADGRKVMLSDTDHIFGVGGDDKWVWRTFTRGLNPIYMDTLDPDNVMLVSARRAMGQTLWLAGQINLAALLPRTDLATTHFCLANVGQEYVVYQPNDATFQVTVGGSASTSFSVTWLNPLTGTTTSSGTVQGGAARSFHAPFSGSSVLWLKR